MVHIERTAFIGLGGNVGNVRHTFLQSIDQMNHWDRTRVTGVSSLYRSAPWGGIQQDDYLNAVVRLETALPATDLHDRMLGLEQQFGRDRATETRWGPRPLDLDLLLFGDESVADDRLNVPHPRMLERAFVMVPLLEIEPGVAIPGHLPVTVTAADYSQDDLRNLGALNRDGN